MSCKCLSGYGALRLVQKRTTMTKLTYTISEAAIALSIGRTTIYKLISERRLRTVKIGARTLIPADQIRALIEPQAA